MARDPTSEFTSRQLAKLLGVALDREPLRSKEDADGAIASALEGRLAGTLPLDTAVVHALPVILGRLCNELIPLQGRRLGEVLLDPQTDLPAIRTIKDYAKKLAARADSEVDYAVGLTLYYAAIASAWLFHRERITKHSLESLAESLEMLIDKRWLPLELGRHLSIAAKACRQEST